MNFHKPPPRLWLSVFLSVFAALSLQAQDGRVDIATLQKLADTGNSDAQFDLGLSYLRGDGVKQDEAKAAEWFQKSADQHNLDAMNAIGTLHEEGVGLPKDEKKAFDWFQKAAKYGHPQAQQNLAECYENGKGVDKSSEEAVKWLERAAQQEWAPSQAAYAWKLEKGEGVTKNTKEAATWYLKAAQDKVVGNGMSMPGLTGAMTHLAYLYYTGVGVPLDYRRAEAWYRRAAKSGDPWALNDIAWFLAVCPDENFHSGEEAVDYARNAVDKLVKQDYQVVDTLAAALARAGQFGEAVQLQTKALVMFTEDKAKEQKPEQTPEQLEKLEKLEKELIDRLESYKKQKAFIEKVPDPEEGTKPLVEDRILQDEFVPRKRPKGPKGGERPDRRPPVVIS